MTKASHVVLERNLTREGVEVHHIIYQSSALQQLRGQVKAKSVRVKLDDPLDLTRILVWHPYRSIWIEVSLPKVRRSVWKRMIARDSHSRVLR
jgi:hypothetical protein